MPLGKSFRSFSYNILYFKYFIKQLQAISDKFTALTDILSIHSAKESTTLFQHPFSPGVHVSRIQGRIQQKNQNHRLRRLSQIS